MKTTFKRLPRVFTGVVLLIAGFIPGTNTLQAQTFSVLHSFTNPPKGPSGLVQGSDGNLYGTTAGGGDADRGTVFRISSSGNLTILHSFHDTDGVAPGAGLVQASDGFFYGTTSGGGTAGFGTVFKVEASGTLTTIHSFGGAEGNEPAADLVQASDGNFYGTTHGGGAGGWGTVFKISPSGVLTTLHSFDQADGWGPRGKLIQASDGALYGTTPLGGMTSTGCNTGCGTVFRITTSGNLTTLHFFNRADGASPEGGLIQGSDGNLYGTTELGGAAGFGTIFRIDTAGTLTTLDFFRGGTDGANPWAALLQASDGSVYGTTFEGGAPTINCSDGCGTVFRSDASGRTTLHSFNRTDGAGPVASLIQASDGNFYGTTSIGGPADYGTIFKIDPTGNLTTLYSFLANEPAGAHGTLIQADDGFLYGTTVQNGSNTDDTGTVFRIDTLGNVTPLHIFTGADGANPYAGLFQSGDGNFYGTTFNGGTANLGTVFRMGAAGNITTLHSFTGADGSNPVAGLVQASDGFFYGAASYGGAHGYGTIFRIDGLGGFTMIHSFAGLDGVNPYGGLIQASDGSLYGTTPTGGTANRGTVFKIDGSGTLTTLHVFTGGGDGQFPSAGIIQGNDGNFYGTTSNTVFMMDSAGTVTPIAALAGGGSGLVQGADGSFYGTTNTGGPGGFGTAFKVDGSGTLTTLHAFGNSDGAYPSAGLVQASDGSFYGTTGSGGAAGAGVVYRLTPCVLSPPPALTVSPCASPNTPGLAASVSGGSGDRFTWAVFGGAITEGQGTSSITFTSGPPGTRMSVQVFETDSQGCVAATSAAVQVDFRDVPAGDPFHTYICVIGRDAITAGCDNGDYCPDSPISRAQMAVFLLKAEHGSSFVPPPCAGVFADVPCPGGPDFPYSDWIEQLGTEEITGGCFTDPLRFCPDRTVTRAEMAVLLLKTEHGSAYAPPFCVGLFQDVPCTPGVGFADWIEKLFAEGVTAGCYTDPLRYCADRDNSRGEMAVFLVKTFGLQ